MTNEEFKQLLSHEEDTWLDWKEDFPNELLLDKSQENWKKRKEMGKAKLLKDLVSIANRDDERNNLGYLVYGIIDHKTDREIKGISNSWKEADFLIWAEKSFDPQIKFKYEELIEEGKRIGIFIIGLSEEFPHVASRSIAGIIHEGQVWFRKASKNTVALYSDLKLMFSGSEPFKFESFASPIIREIENHYRDQGDEVSLSSFEWERRLFSQGF